jgi:hypothetical protein
MNGVWIKQDNLFASYNILRPYGDYTVTYARSDPGPTGVASAANQPGPITIYGFPAQYAGAAFVQNEYLNYPNSSAPITKVLELIVTKRVSGKMGLTTSITGIRDHAVINPLPASPNANYFNYDRTWNWQAKSTLYYNLPWKVVVSSTLEAYNGVYGQRTVNYLGIPNVGTVTIPVEPFGAEEGPDKVLWNVQFGREFLFKERYRLKPSVDILNLLNRADQWTITYVSGPNFHVPTVIDTPRIARFGMVFSF